MARSLFMLTATLLAVTVLAAVGVSQLFQSSSATLIEQHARKPDVRLTTYRAAMQTATSTYAQDEKDKTSYRVPVSRAIDLLIKSPARLRATRPPKGFVHPDDEQK